MDALQIRGIGGWGSRTGGREERRVRSEGGEGLEGSTALNMGV